MQPDAIAKVISDPNYDGHLVVGEFSETILGLRHLAEFLKRTPDDRFFWKWAIFSAHSLLQNSFVAILTQTSGVGALTRKSEELLLERLDMDWHSEVPWPREKLAYFLELTRRAFPLIDRELPSKPDWGNYDLETDIMRLHLFRNGFAHLKSETWLIETVGLPRVISHSMDVVEEIIDSKKFKRWNRYSQFDWQHDLQKVRAELKKLETT